MLQITEANFHEHVSSDKPLVVDFYTTWCGPCRMLDPQYKAWAQKYEQATFAKCDVEASSLAGAYGVSAMSTIIVFKGGKESKRFVGAPSEKDLAEAIS